MGAAVAAAVLLTLAFVAVHAVHHWARRALGACVAVWLRGLVPGARASVRHASPAEWKLRGVSVAFERGHGVIESLRVGEIALLPSWISVLKLAFARGGAAFPVVVKDVEVVLASLDAAGTRQRAAEQQQRRARQRQQAADARRERHKLGSDNSERRAEGVRLLGRRIDEAKFGALQRLAQLVEVRVVNATVHLSGAADTRAATGNVGVRNMSLRCVTLQPESANVVATMGHVCASTDVVDADLEHLKVQATLRLNAVESLCSGVAVSCSDAAVLVRAHAALRVAEVDPRGNAGESADCGADLLELIEGCPLELSLQVCSIGVCVLMEDAEGRTIRPIEAECSALRTAVKFDRDCWRASLSSACSRARVVLRAENARYPSRPREVATAEKALSMVWSSSTSMTVDVPLPIDATCWPDNGTPAARELSASMQMQLDYASAVHRPALLHWVDDVRRVHVQLKRIRRARQSTQTAAEVKEHSIVSHIKSLDWTFSLEGQGWQLQLTEPEQLQGDSASLQLATMHVTAVIPSPVRETNDNAEVTVLMSGADLRLDSSAWPLLQGASVVTSLEFPPEDLQHGPHDIQLEIRGARACVHTKQLELFAGMSQQWRKGTGHSAPRATSVHSERRGSMRGANFAVRLVQVEVQVLTTAPAMPSLVVRAQDDPPRESDGCACLDFATSVVVGEMEVCGELVEGGVPLSTDVLLSQTWVRGYQGTSEVPGSSALLTVDSASLAARWPQDNSAACERGRMPRTHIFVSGVEACVDVETCVAVRCVAVALQAVAATVRASADVDTTRSGVAPEIPLVVSLSFQIKDACAVIALMNGKAFVVRASALERFGTSTVVMLKRLAVEVDGHRMLTAADLTVRPPSYLLAEDAASGVTCPGLDDAPFRPPSIPFVAETARRVLAPAARWLLESSMLALDAPLTTGLRATYNAVDETMDMITSTADAVKAAFDAANGLRSPTKIQGSIRPVLQFNIARLTTSLQDSPLERWMAIRAAAMAATLPERVAREALFEQAAREQLDGGDAELVGARARLDDTLFASFKRAWETASMAANARYPPHLAGAQGYAPPPPHGMIAATCVDMKLRVSRLSGPAVAIAVARSVDPAAREVELDESRARGFAFSMTSGAASLHFRQHTSPLAQLTSGHTYGVIAGVAEVRGNLLASECKNACAEAEQRRVSLGHTLDWVESALEPHSPPTKFYVDVGVSVEDGRAVCGPGYEADLSDVIQAMSFHSSEGGRDGDAASGDLAYVGPTPSPFKADSAQRPKLTISVPPVPSPPALISPPSRAAFSWWDDLRLLVHGQIDIWVSNASLTILGGCGALGEGERSQRLVSVASGAAIQVAPPSSLVVRSKNVRISHVEDLEAVELLRAPEAEFSMGMDWQCGFDHDPSQHFLHAFTPDTVNQESLTPRWTPPSRCSAITNLQRRMRAFRATAVKATVLMRVRGDPGSEDAAGRGAHLSLAPESMMRFKAFVLAIVRPPVSVVQVSPLRSSKPAVPTPSPQTPTCGRAPSSGRRGHRGRSLGSILEESTFKLEVEPLATTFDVAGLPSEDQDIELYSLHGRAKSLSVMMRFVANTLDELKVDLLSVRVHLDLDDVCSSGQGFACDEAAWTQDNRDTFVASASSLSIRQRLHGNLSMKDLEPDDREALQAMLVRQGTPPRLGQAVRDSEPSTCLRIAIVGLHMMWTDQTRASVMACWLGTVAGLRHPYASRTGRAAAALAASILSHGPSHGLSSRQSSGAGSSPGQAPQVARRARTLGKSFESKGDDLLALLNRGVLTSELRAEGKHLETNEDEFTSPAHDQAIPESADPIFLVVDVSKAQLCVQSGSASEGHLLLESRKARLLGRHGMLDQGGTLTSYSLNLQNVRTWVARHDVNPGATFSWAPENGESAASTASMRNISGEGCRVGLSVRKFTPPEAAVAEQTEVVVNSPSLAVAVDGHQFSVLVGAALTLGSRMDVIFRRSPVSAPAVYEALRAASLVHGSGLEIRTVACALVADARLLTDMANARHLLLATHGQGPADAIAYADPFWMVSSKADALVLPLGESLRHKVSEHGREFCTVLDMAASARRERIARRGNDNQGARPAAVYVEASLGDARFDILDSGPSSSAAPFSTVELRGATLSMARHEDRSAEVIATVSKVWVDAVGSGAESGGSSRRSTGRMSSGCSTDSGSPSQGMWRVLGVHEDAGWGKGDVMLRVRAEQGRSVPGKTFLTHLETQVFPLSINVTESLMFRAERFLGPLWAQTASRTGASGERSVAPASPHPRGGGAPLPPAPGSNSKFNHRRQRSETVLGLAFSPLKGGGSAARHRRQNSDKIPSTFSAGSDDASSPFDPSSDVGPSRLPKGGAKRKLKHTRSMSVDASVLARMGVDSLNAVADPGPPPAARRLKSTPTPTPRAADSIATRVTADYIRMNEVKVVVAYAGSPFSFSSAHFQLPPRVFHSYEVRKDACLSRCEHARPHRPCRGRRWSST